MKKLVVAMALLLSVTGFGQTKEKEAKKKEHTEKTKGDKRGDRFMEDFKDLGLTEKQQVELKALYESERKHSPRDKSRYKGDSDRPSESEMKEMREKMKQRREALDGRVKTIHNVDQYSKWKEQQDAKMRERLSRG